MLALLLALSSTAIHAQDGRVYVYKVEHTASYDYDTPSNIGSRAAVFALDSAAGDCVDLRDLGSSMSGEFSDGHVKKSIHGTIGFVLNRRLTPDEEKKLKQGMCKDIDCDDSDVCTVPLKPSARVHDCTASVSMTSFPIADLQVESYGRSDVLEHASLRDIKKKLPAFSLGCYTGKYEDSWINTATTKESRELLKQLGLDVNKARTLDLATNDGKQIWSFGFAKHDAPSASAAPPAAAAPRAGSSGSVDAFRDR
jgi:hypothetical protein